MCPARGGCCTRSTCGCSPTTSRTSIEHAGDELLFVDASLTDLLAPLRDRLSGVKTFVVMEDGGEVNPAFAADPRYEQLLASAPSGALADPRS